MPGSSVDVLQRFSPLLPEAMVPRVEGWVPGSTPVPARRASSVVVLREGPGLETYLLQRHARMAFAASMVVFPGGGLDPVDEVAPDPWRACAVRETLEETGVRLRPDDLLAWAEWTTPEFEPRRYETRFYVAVLPAGQDAADLSGETDDAAWLSPATALDRAEQGSLALMPPTRSILVELAELGSVAEVRAAAVDRVIVPVTPEVVRDAGGWRFRYPEAP